MKVIEKIKQGISFSIDQRYYHQPKYAHYIFIFLFIVIAFAYSYNEILPLRPQSLHQWRQCDCLSITMNFYKEKMSFFDPSVHCQGSAGSTSGHTISEFPIIYFTVAALWRIFGHHEWIFRLLEILIVFGGLLALFKTIERILKDSFWAMLLTFLFFSSPMLVYYTNNFIANTPALGLALVGFYWFWRFYESGQSKHLLFMCIFYLLGGLIKITALYSFIVIIFVFLTESTGLVHYKKEGRIFTNPARQLLMLGSVLLLITSWYLYARNYNLSHGAGYFLIGVLPIWNVAPKELDFIIESIRVEWIKHYYSKPILVISALMLILNLIFLRKHHKLFFTFVVLLFIGLIGFFLLFFKVFAYHDYYLLNMLFIFPILFISTFLLLKSHFPKVFNAIAFRLLMTILLVINISYASKNIHKRYHSWYNLVHKNNYEALEDITPYLRSLGIERDDKVISLPDGSFNISLYLMDQKGWTQYCDIHSNPDKIREKIKLGAKYLVVHNPKVYEEGYVQPFIKNKIGSYKGVDIYRLPTE